METTAGGADTSNSHTASQLSTGVDQPAVLTPAQLLAAADGATPVAFAQPAYGRISYGERGTILYTPNEGFRGTDQMQLTTTDAVKVYTVDTPLIATVGGVTIQGSGDGSAIAAVPGASTRSMVSATAGPTSTAATTTKKCCQSRTFICESTSSGSPTAPPGW